MTSDWLAETDSWTNESDWLPTNWFLNQRVDWLAEDGFLNQWLGLGWKQMIGQRNWLACWDRSWANEFDSLTEPTLEPTDPDGWQIPILVPNEVWLADTDSWSNDSGWLDRNSSLTAFAHRNRLWQGNQLKTIPPIQPPMLTAIETQKLI